MKYRLSPVKGADVAEYFPRECYRLIGILAYALRAVSIRADGNYLAAELAEAPEVFPVCAHPQSYFEINSENY